MAVAPFNAPRPTFHGDIHFKVVNLTICLALIRAISRERELHEQGAATLIQNVFDR
jgi:hypothetical protein